MSASQPYSRSTGVSLLLHFCRKNVLPRLSHPLSPCRPITWPKFNLIESIDQVCGSLGNKRLSSDKSLANAADSVAQRLMASVGSGSRDLHLSANGISYCVTRAFSGPSSKTRCRRGRLIIWEALLAAAMEHTKSFSRRTSSTFFSPPLR